ncbi:hypothetical protein K8U54_12960 [Pseudomonas fulva]|uniref:DUF6631 family protein n=1 Tax=Pseudomonas fulva TaxID=47880 RepID=UPI00201D878F|nr:DUF6631 family protein [Pseudomonas fulva]UQY32654.1 hypothetical protein K8U54_12960 [Pseudomonas fulva]
MAVRAKPPAKRKQAASAADAGANDLEVLHPDRPVTIAGREVVVREYGFIEGQRLLPMLKPFLDDLKTLLVNDEPLRIGDVQTFLGCHIDAITEAVAIAADVDQEWMASLNQDEGQTLLMIWWSVNGPFYVRSAHGRIQADQAVAKAVAGLTSTQP